MELRVRTLCELVINESYYLQPSITSLLNADGIGKNALVATSANYDKASCRNVNCDLARTVLRLDCLATPKNGEWSNMFHVHGLASVLKKSIISIYPETNDRIRPLFHCEVPPRTLDIQPQDSIPIIIMWTHLCDKPEDKINIWSPNHFVPCISRQSDMSIAGNILSSSSLHYNKDSIPKSSSTSPVQIHPISTLATQQQLINSQVSLSPQSIKQQANASFTLSLHVSPTANEPGASLPPQSTNQEANASFTLSLSPTANELGASLSPQPADHKDDASFTLSSFPVSNKQRVPFSLQSTKQQTSNAGEGAYLSTPPKKSQHTFRPLAASSPLKVSRGFPLSSQMTKQQTTVSYVPSYSLISSEESFQELQQQADASFTPSSLLISSEEPSFSSQGIKQQSTASFTLSSSLISSKEPSPSSQQIKWQANASSFSLGRNCLTQPKKLWKSTCTTISKNSSKLSQLPVTSMKQQGPTRRRILSPSTTSPSSAAVDTTVIFNVLSDSLHQRGTCAKRKARGDSSSESITKYFGRSLPRCEGQPISSCVDKQPAFKLQPIPKLNVSSGQSLSLQPVSEHRDSCASHDLQLNFHRSCSVATSTIFNILSNSMHRPETCKKKSSSACSSFIVKHFQSSHSPENKSSPQTYDISSHSKQGEKTPSLISDNSEIVHNSSDDSDDDYFEYTFHGDSKDDNLHEMECSTSKATTTSSNSESEEDLDPDNFKEAYSHSDPSPFPGDCDDDNLWEMEYSTFMATSTSSDSESEKDLEPDNLVEAYSHSDPLPFPGVSPEWYEKQRTMEVHNATREQRRSAYAAEVNDRGSIVSVVRSCVDGQLEENILSLQNDSQCLPCGPKKQHLLSLIAVGEYILQHGPVVKTQDVGNVYNQEKGLTRRKFSMELYEIFSKHLNLAQIYMFNTAYLTQNTSNLTAVISSITSVINSEDIVKSTIQDQLNEKFPQMLKYLDSHRDRQVLKALIADLTNTSFAAKLQGVKNRKGTRNASTSVSSHLLHYSKIRATSQIVRSDMTNVQQFKLTERIISARKFKEIKTISEGRGRKLKSTHFPELCTVLSYAFGEIDGGIQAHPRLTTGTLYRCTDNAMTMKQAREILLSVAPKGFNISLSSCFNYTENYRKGSIQSKQHHAGKGVNAPLSLRKPPRTGVEQLVINLHWTTSNVNLIVDSCHGLSHCLVVSKDAKSIIQTDIAPVQHPGHSWKKRLELPDHTWDQSRVNAVTPMTFLFLLTKIDQLPASSVNLLDIQVSDTTVLQLTRTGQSITLINISFYEPETTFKCLNEILYLLLSELDVFFRDSRTQELKKEWVFVVDNGPAEQPNCFLVKMCLVRLLNFLKLDKICQVSFAEYHSKRNFVERVHAEENRVLSKHGPFTSTPIHQQAPPGTNKHKENMEHVADQVCNCIQQGSFGGRSLLCFRGVRQEDYVFSDEKQLHNFLGLSEEGKSLFSPLSYSVTHGSILKCIALYWKLDTNFQGEYMADYKLINNALLDGVRTSWTDKYTTSLYSLGDIQCRRYELQPIPDYLRWFRTGELHYLALEERALLRGPWDEIPASYMPSRILDLCLSLVQDLTDDLINQIALLSWVTPSEVRRYKTKLDDQLEHQIKSEREKSRWKTHSLYQDKTKPQLEAMCRELRIPVTSSLQKYQLVSLIAQKKGEVPPPEPSITQYCGKVQDIPTAITRINNTMTIPHLRSILKYHDLPHIGTKEQLVMRVYLLRHNKSAAAAAREEEQLRDLIHLAYKTIREQRRLSITTHVYRKRKFTLQNKDPHFVPQPQHVQTEEDLQSLFEPLLIQINSNRKKHEVADEMLAFKPQLSSCDTTSTDEKVLHQCITQVGSRVKLQWTCDEIGTSGWKPGWYVATVQSYCVDTDVITVTYQAEPNVTYDEELTPLITGGKIKLLWSPI